MAVCCAPECLSGYTWHCKRPNFQHSMHNADRGKSGFDWALALHRAQLHDKTRCETEYHHHSVKSKRSKHSWSRGMKKT